MPPPGWKKDPVWRAFVEMKQRARCERLLERRLYEEQMRAVDAAAQQILNHEMTKVPKDVPRH